MPGHLHDPTTRELLADALVQELPDVTPERMSAALERAVARVIPAPARVVDELAAGADPIAIADRIREAEALFRDIAEWEQLVDLHLARVSASEHADERASILIELAELFEHEMEDLDRAIAARLGSFGEAPWAWALPDLERLTRMTGRWTELALRLDEVAGRDLDDETAAAVAMTQATVYRDGIGDPAGELAALERAFAADPRRADVLRTLADTYVAAGRLPDALDLLARLVDVVDGDSARADLYREMAGGWERLGLVDRAAECHEWVLSFAPGDAVAYDELTRLYRQGGRWRALIDTLGRRATERAPADRAPLFLEIARIYQCELGDEDGAIDFYQAADDALPGRPDVLSALARLYQRREAHDDAMATLERLVAALPAGREQAAALVSASEIAWRELNDADMAQDLLIRARRADADYAPAIDALIDLHRDRGEHIAAIELLELAAARPALAEHKARMLFDAGQLAHSLADETRAADLYAAAHAADPAHDGAALALAALLWQSRRHDQLVPLLESLCEATDDPAVLRVQLWRLGEAAAARGDQATARRALTRAVELDPEHRGARRALGDLLFASGDWGEARTVLEKVLDDEEDSLPVAACVELHYRVGRCAHELDDADRARLHIETALALAPDHRPSLLIHAELDADDPVALIADKLALANTAPPEEKAALLAAIGDFYADEMGDNVSAREIYREALLYRPTDHILLNKCLGVTAEEGDWQRSLELVERLIDSERDRQIRARYRQVAAMICRDELDRPRQAAALLYAALDDAPTSMQAADELETLLAGNPGELARFYYQRLEQLRAEEVRPGERLRLWDRLARVCLELGRPADAICAYEVAIELEPDSVSRRQRLADLYIEPGIDARDKAIAQHQQILAGSKRRVASYEALRSLYAEVDQPEKADACADALAIVGMRPVTGRSRTPTAEPMALTDDATALSQSDYTAIAMGEVDRMLSALFMRVAPAFASERARPKLSGRSALRDGDPRPAARAFRHVASVLGVARPAAHVKREQAATCLLSLRQNGDQLAPVATLGRRALQTGTDERALVFDLARRLIDLRSDRFAQLLCPRAEELTQIVEFALALGSGDGRASIAELGHTARWLANTLRPVDLDQLMTIGSRLAERGVDPGRAALGWLEATERVADRVGYLLTGDLAICVRALESEPAVRSSKNERILDLVWASVTEPMFDVRARLESWDASAETASGKNHVA